MVGSRNTVNCLSLSSLPSEILIYIANSPDNICLLAQTNKLFCGILSDDLIWQPIFNNYRRYAYRKKDHVSYKAATLGINHARFSVEHLFARIFALSSLHMRNSFLQGINPARLKELEEENNVLLPQLIKEYFMLVNGQMLVPFGEGFLHGMRLLTLEESIDEFKLRKQKGRVVTDSAVGLPLTIEFGFSQIVASEKTGAIYLETKWDVYNKSANWVFYLCDVMGIH